MRALHKKKSVKAIVISGISLLLVAAIVVGVLWYLGHRSEPVKVAPVSMFMGWLSNESTQSGNVTADNLQKIYASDTQTVTALLVQEGQTVKKGDPLFRYDTTLSDIQVERQEIAVKKDDLNLNKAKKDLANINRLRPYVPTQPTDPPTEPTEPEPTDEPTQPPEPTEPTVPIAPEELPYLMGGEGTQASPLFYLCAADMQYDQSYFEELLGEKTELWVVFQVREGNALHAELLSELPLKLTRDEETQTIRFTVFVPEQDDVQTETQAAPRVSPGPDVTVVDYDGEYTAAEIAKMRAEKQKEIRDLDLKLRMDKVELERMKREAANGVVTSALDGTVLRVNDPDTAKQEGSPVIVVSGGGGYYVKTGVTELDRDKYPVGTQMRIQSWEHGEVYGTVAEISDTPVPSSNNPYYSSGNQNVSFYTMLIALDADSPLREDEWVDVYFNAASTTSEDALRIETRFIRQDDGGSYVYRRGEDQLLHNQLTHDHSYVQELVDCGTITVEEAEHHPQKNIITRALGVDYRLDPEFTSLAVQPGDILLLCSDGLTNAVPRSQLEQLLRTGSFYDLPDLLIRAANENGGKDNITALLLGVEPLEVHHG